MAGGVVAAYRASLLVSDRWAEVRAAFSAARPDDETWVDTASGEDWVPWDGYVALLEAVARVIGVEGLRSLVRRRIIDPEGSNFFAPMLRSWARSFGESPEHMLRGAVQAWRTAQRNVGTIVLHSVGAGEVHLALEGPRVGVYGRSAAMAASLEGLALGFLDSAHPRPVFVEVELQTRGQAPTLVCRFDESGESTGCTWGLGRALLER